MKLDVLNEGFSDPKMISLAYYQASLVVEHLVETYGEPKLHAAAARLRRGLEDEDGDQGGLGVSLAQLQTSFDARLEKQYSGLRRALKTPGDEGEDVARRPEDAGRRQSRELPRADAAGPGAARSQGQRRRDCGARARRAAHARARTARTTRTR